MDAIAEIKQKLDIVDVIGGYVSLKKAGKNYRAVCPFHSENTPSFMVSPELQIYKCFGCNEAGDIFSFVKKIEGVEFPEALKTLADRAGVKLEGNVSDEEGKQKKKILFINDLAAKFYHHILTKHKAGKIGLEYLKEKRGLSDDTITGFVLGYAPDTWDLLYRFLRKNDISEQDMLSAGVITERREGKGYIDKFRGRIIFPLTGVDGKIVGFTGRTIFDREPKYLNTSETAVFHKTHFLYGLDRAKIAVKKEGAVFVEGQTDVISAHQAGIDNVIASSGTSLTDSQLRLLQRYTKDITFCFDSDTAGVAAIFRAVEMAERQNFNVTVLPIPAPFKDLDELIRKSPEAAKNVLAEPVPAYDFFLASIIKKHGKDSAIGKKQIVDEFLPLISRISNKVLYEHYAKKLATELQITEDAVFGMLSEVSKPNARPSDRFLTDKYATAAPTALKSSPEAYLLSLLLNANIDTMKKYVYKLDSKGFSTEALRIIAESLVEFLDKVARKFSATKFLRSLPEEVREIATDLHMYDFGELTGRPELLGKEIETTLERLSKEKTKRDLKELSEKIRLTELENDTELTEKLTAKFKKLSKRLL